MKWYKLAEEIPLRPIEELYSIRKELAQVAQSVYDDWGEDEFGNIFCRYQEGPGGICHLISDDIVDFINNRGFDATTLSSDSRVHVSTVVKTMDGMVEVDIDPYRYESGGGYEWEKIPDVQFDPEDISITVIDSDPQSFENYIEYYNQ